MNKQLLFFIITLITTITACRKSDIDTIQPISLSVQVSYTQEDSALGLSKENIPVKITNLISGQELTANTNEDGIAIFASIPPGNYTISASRNYTAEEFYNKTEIFVGTNVAYNGTESEAINQNANIKITLQSGKIGDLVFKQIYYAGSNTKTGAMFRDQFIEIYNNSNQTIYLDSLFIGSSFSENGSIASGNSSFDWAQAIGMPGGIGNANNDYLYFRYLFMIPGSGKDHPLEPGQSIIIAQTALNHTQPFNGNDGKVISVTDPTLTVDLSTAEFEVNAVAYDEAQTDSNTVFKPYKSDVDNPQVPNLNIIYMNTTNDWVMDSPGREDFIMFKSNSSFNTWLKYPDPTATEIKASTSYGIQVPVKVAAPNETISDILDAVEVIRPVESQRAPKRLWNTLDATGTFVAGGQYSSQSLIRKTVKVIEGRRILQDTNNSQNDFQTKTKADPSKSVASFEI
ncbi:DUF4876 domain-containing protein [Niabella terrae]